MTRVTMTSGLVTPRQSEIVSGQAARWEWQDRRRSGIFEVALRRAA
jgi:hypothetical protein